VARDKGAAVGSGFREGEHWLGSVGSSEREEVAMLWTIFVILLVLWLLGVVTSYSLGGFIHVLLVIAVILAVMQLIQGRRAL
jgi:predicted ferric reductase